MDPDSQGLLPFEEEKDGQLSDVDREYADVLHRESKPRVQRWTTKFIFIQVALIVLYTIVSAVVASFYIKKALSPHSTHIFTNFVLMSQLNHSVQLPFKGYPSAMLLRSSTT